MSIYFINTKTDGLSVYPEMNISDIPTRKIKFGDGFTSYEIQVKSATQIWARISPDTLSPKEYVLISLASKRFAEAHPDNPENIVVNPEWILEIDQFMRMRGFTGVAPLL